MRKRHRLARLATFLATIIAAAFIASSGAAAAVSTYAGGIEDVNGSRLSFDVSSKRVKGRTVRTVTAVRGSGIPVYCRGGSNTEVSIRFRANAPVGRDGRFSATIVRTTDGLDSVTYIRGEIQGRNASGRLSTSDENVIFDSCSTGVLRYFADRAQPMR